MFEFIAEFFFYITGGLPLVTMQWHVLFLMSSSLLIWVPFWILFFIKSDRTHIAAFVCGTLFLAWVFTLYIVENRQYALTNECIETLAYSQTENVGRIDIIITECREKNRVSDDNFSPWRAENAKILRGRTFKY